MEKIGILGGTFDPIHYGHLLIAENVLDTLSLDYILFVPTGTPPHKRGCNVTDAAHRVSMVRLAIEGNPKFRLSTIESEREGVCYTAETAALLREQNKGAAFYYIVGADALRDMAGWYRPEDIFRLLHIVAVNRSGDCCDVEGDARRLTQAYGADITMVQLPRLDISSTDIRSRKQKGKTVRYLLPDKVAHYMEEHGLYD